jgi:hypothetical protein
MTPFDNPTAIYDSFYEDDQSKALISYSRFILISSLFFKISHIINYPSAPPVAKRFNYG